MGLGIKRSTFKPSDQKGKERSVATFKIVFAKGELQATLSVKKFGISAFPQ
ncbi:hypothetical protein L21SP5_01400 [Salinivirga cyanobacteriivorans]|uniref:Uncharacterized protein n=1 Tax=Salinivirga cyanobacteriivorans TaxID=1307839 RepID=A0A0S2HYB2_9BACT|nr:hypothetical protein L21SP5_01400 [Salinivirga cyanobacteriivorans]